MTMTAGLSGLRVGLLERRHPPGHRGSLIEQLAPALRAAGACVTIVHAEEGWHRLDRCPAWDVTVLKSGSVAALHLAAAAEAWGIPAVNGSEPTRLAQDKLASTAILRQRGLPLPVSHLIWLEGEATPALTPAVLAALSGRKLLVKAARGSQGAGLWSVEPGHLPAQLAALPPGPYLIAEWVPHGGPDLKVYVAGSWMTAIERPFPAKTLEEKLGRPVAVPDAAAVITRATGDALGLACYGCDFVSVPDGWVLVDVNAFPGYKGAEGAAEAITAEIARTMAERAA
jgi:ribosomal protein S6--L-glutamate ligase